MKYLPVDVSTFSTMINGNYIYVDKTKYIYDMFKGGFRYYFLSRPRRFGKSLLISTLKEFFSGNKELFKDLWVYNSDYKWESFPVIHIDFSIIDRKTPERLELSLSWNLSVIAQDFGIDVSQAPTLNAKFAFLVQQLAQTNKVVILIDEYDKPILDHITEFDVVKSQQEVLSSFYGTIKGLDEYLRAVFITGVTKFSKTSIFSGINNLIDLTMEPEASVLLGYTKEEIEKYFPEFLNQVCDANKLTHQEAMKAMENWYNGYRFSSRETRVYNPFSVLYYLKNKRLSNYWFESGTSSFLVKLIRGQYVSLEELSRIEISSSSLGIFEVDNIPLIPLLFQAGYLTIKDYNEQTGKFVLGYPNHEVEEFLTLIGMTFTTKPESLKVECVAKEI